LRALFGEVATSKDRRLKERIKLIRDEDAEAWFSYFLDIWDSKSKMNWLGDWQPRDVARNILAIAQQAEAEHEWEKNNKAVDQENASGSDSRN
jgi:hypothetical protein